MSLDILSENQWSTFYIQDFTDAEKMTELKKVSPFMMRLRADGQELEFIRQRFENLPITKGNLCTWRNPLAEFILMNLNNQAEQTK